MTELESKIINIQERLSDYYTETDFRGEGRLFDIERKTDRFYCGLLNAILELMLILVDVRDRRYSCLSLVDQKNRTAVVVTPCATPKKRRHTLEQFVGGNLHHEFDRLIFLSTEAKNAAGASCTIGDEKKTMVEFWNRKKLLEREADISEHVCRWLSSYVDDWDRDDKPAYRLSGLPGACEHFVDGSRDGELATLKEYLYKKEPIFVTGVGGIGKTQTVIQLAKRVAPRRGAYMIRYEHPREGAADLLRETILKARFFGYRFMGTDNAAKDHEYRERMEILRTQYSGAMLILDNLDCPGKSLDEVCAGETFRELQSMDLQLIVTTRSPGYKRCNVPISALEKDDLLQMMKKIIQTDEYPDDELMELIDFVDGHTLTVYLMAKSLRDGWWMGVSAATLLTALKNRSLSKELLPEISTDQNQSYGYAKIYDHLRVLVVGMSGLTEVDSMVMRCAMLIPDDGMQEVVFQRGLSGEQRDSLELLIERGLIQRESYQDWGTSPVMLTIHPVIRTVGMEELKPTGASCNTFLQRLLKSYNPDDTSASISKESVEQIAKLLSNVSDLEDPDGRWAVRAARYWEKHGDDEEALKYNLRALDRANGSMNPRDIITIYNQLANTYYNLEEPGKAMEYHKKALEKREEISSDELRMAHTYNNIGNSYGSQGDFAEALRYHEKALEIAKRSEARGMVTVDLAKYYTNVGLSLYKLGEDEQAMKNLLRTLEIFKSCLHPDHPDFAQAYERVGMVYDRMGDHTTALEYRHKALEIFERELPEDHPELARAYNNIGNTMLKLEKYKSALAYQLRGLEIRQATMKPDNPNLAATYINIGITFRKLQEHERALEYLMKALEIRERIYPDNHLQVGICCKFIGESHQALGNQREALIYLERAIGILKLHPQEDSNWLPAAQMLADKIRRKLILR